MARAATIHAVPPGGCKVIGPFFVINRRARGEPSHKSPLLRSQVRPVVTCNGYLVGNSVAPVEYGDGVRPAAVLFVLLWIPKRLGATVLQLITQRAAHCGRLKVLMSHNVLHHKRAVDQQKIHMFFQPSGVENRLMCSVPCHFHRSVPSDPVIDVAISNRFT